MTSDRLRTVSRSVTRAPSMPASTLPAAGSGRSVRMSKPSTSRTVGAARAAYLRPVLPRPSTPTVISDNRRGRGVGRSSQPRVVGNPEKKGSRRISARVRVQA